jgi:hypothetical protein
MTSKVSDAELAQALLQSVEHGVYPDTEDLVSADFTSAIAGALELLDKAAEDVKVCGQIVVELYHAKRDPTE